MPPALRIRITAAVDASFERVLASMQTASRRAGKKIGDDIGAGALIGAGPYRSMPAKIGEPLAKAGAEGKKFQGVMGSVADGARQKFEQLSTELRKMPAELQAVASVARNELAKIERANARAALGLGPKTPGFWASQHDNRANQWAGSVVSRIGMGALGAGVQLGAEFLHGIGVNTDLGSMWNESQKNELLFRNISSFGYMPGTQGANQERIDPATLLKEAHGVGQRTGFSANEIGQGLEKFVGLTGDLDLGRKSLENMAVLSKATGSSFEEMVEAAGAASNSLGDMPNKADVLYAVMKQVSSEGKTGAILIKDMAVQMAKIAAASQMFAGDRATTIGTLGAMAQEARGRGGASSATQAATAVQQFTNVFKKRQRLDTFSGFGMQVYEAGGGLRDPQKLIAESFVAAMMGGHRLTPGGKQIPMPGGINWVGGKEGGQGWQAFETNLTALYGDVKAMRATAGFEDKFKTAFTDTKGTDQQKLAAATAAVNEEFHRLKVDMMDEATVQKDFQLAMATSKSTVAVFNDKMQETAEDFQRELLPAVTALAPDMVLLGKGVAHAVQMLLGIKPPGDDNGMKGFWAELGSTFGYKGGIPGFSPGTGETQDQANRATSMGQAVLGAAGLVNSRGVAGGAVSGLPDYAALPAPNAVTIPEAAESVLSEHAVKYAGAVALAHGRLNEARAARAKALNVDPSVSDEEMAKKEEGRGYGDVWRKGVEAAKQELMSAEQAQALAITLSNAVKEGLRNGHFTVTVTDDKTPKPTKADNDPGSRSDPNSD